MCKNNIKHFDHEMQLFLTSIAGEVVKIITSGQGQGMLLKTVYWSIVS